MSNTPIMEQPLLLRIININVNKSIHSQTDFLNRLDPREWDIVCIQEPGFDFRHTTRSTRKWTVVYPKGHDLKVKRTRSIILVNAELPTSSWKALPVESVDVAAVQLTGKYGKIRVFSVYNDQKNDASMNTIDMYLQDPQAVPAGEVSLHDIWIGDFNRHSPLWDDPRNNQLFTAEATRRATRLVNMAAKWTMQMALPAGLPTLEHASSKVWTRPDNVWVDADLIANVVKCDVLEALRPTCTDHLPFMIYLDTAPDRKAPEERWDWRGTS